MIRILHTADFHMDSPFEGLPGAKAAVRRSEQRALLRRMAELAEDEKADAVLLAGDLFDSDNSYYETGEELVRTLRYISAPVFISPGNHDFYSPRSPWARLEFSSNVHIFRNSRIEYFDFSEKGFRVFGAGFTDRSCKGLLDGFTLGKKPGVVDIMCIHGDPGKPDSRYNGVGIDQIAASNLDYIGFGHVHGASGLLKAGNTWYSTPGCPEGRGFDETGEKTVNIISIDNGECSLETRCISSRKYEIMELDVSSIDPMLAMRMELPDDTLRDVYRVVLKGNVQELPDTELLKNALGQYFFELQIRDGTRLVRDIWEKAGEDTLRGMFLEKLRQRYDECKTDEDKKFIEQAVRWGLAALDNAEEVAIHDN